MCAFKRSKRWCKSKNPRGIIYAHLSMSTMNILKRTHNWEVVGSDEKLQRTMHSFPPLSLSQLRPGSCRLLGNRDWWCLGVQAAEGRPLPGPSDADRAGEFSFGRLELGGPISSRFSAIVVSFGRLLQVDSWDYLLARKLRSVKPILFI